MAGQVYWVGADNNIYLKGANGVHNVGPASQSKLMNGGFESNTLGQSVQAARIADPNAPAASTPAPAGGTPAPALNTGAVQNTQLTIDQLPALLQAALASEGTGYHNATGALQAQQDEQQKTYDASTTTNQQNYDSNFMDSIRAGIKGLGGLMALLRGTGAAGGTADKQVQDVVGGQTADDIRGGSDTQKANQSSLDSSLSQFLTDLKSKKAAADDTHANNVAAINRDSATQLQDLYGKMAGYYGDAQDSGDANRFMSMAGALTPQIAANSTTQTTPYDTTPVAVQAPQVTAFAAPSQPNVAAIPQNGQVGSGIFTMAKRKDDTTPTPAVPVAAAQGA